MACVQVGDYVGSKRHHTNLVKSDWTGNNEWLVGAQVAAGAVQEVPVGRQVR